MVATHGHLVPLQRLPAHEQIVEALEVEMDKLEEQMEGKL